MEKVIQKRIHTRRLLFYFMVFSFAVLPVSGFLLHLYSKGQLDGQVRHACMAVHNLSAAVFLVAVIVHVAVNRKSVGAYLKAKMDFMLPRARELFIALSVMALLVVLGVRHAFH